MEVEQLAVWCKKHNLTTSTAPTESPASVKAHSTCPTFLNIFYTVCSFLQTFSLLHLFCTVFTVRGNTFNFSLYMCGETTIKEILILRFALCFWLKIKMKPSLSLNNRAIKYRLRLKGCIRETTFPKFYIRY